MRGHGAKQGGTQEDGEEEAEPQSAFVQINLKADYQADLAEELKREALTYRLTFVLALGVYFALQTTSFTSNCKFYRVIGELLFVLRDFLFCLPGEYNQFHFHNNQS